MAEQKRFKAIVAEFLDDTHTTLTITEKNISDLPDNEVLIKVSYSSLNYKDALSARGNKGITRSYPHTPGIDAAGVVVRSKNPCFSKGEKVLVTGFDLGMNTPGGFAEYIQVPSHWVIPLPEGLTLKESMILGTAGFTAALSLFKLKQAGIEKEMGEILITGASGGLGSTAIAILTKAGYQTVAVTGKKEAAPYLKALGAKKVLPREALSESSQKPMLSKAWAGAVDTVGGSTLENVIKSIHQNGAVAVCGLVASPFISLSVYPFILRGITVCGIDSATCPEGIRKMLWEKLSGSWKPDVHALFRNEVPLKALDKEIASILKGSLLGRTLVSLDSEA